MNEAQIQREETANVITHGIGLALAILACIYFAVTRDSTLRLVTGLVFGAGLIFVYFTSTLFHAVRRPRLKLRWRTLDHAAIYVLIASTYTAVLPFAPGGWSGWILAGVIWAAGLFGIVKKLRMIDTISRVSHLDLVLYIAMGWAWLILAVPIWNSLTDRGFWWLLAGGLSYTFGTIFFANDRIPYNHAIWHLFVLGGSICHFVMVGWYR